MPRTPAAVRLAVGLVVALVVAPVIASEPAANSPSATYLAYRAALLTASSLDDLRPWLAKDGIAKLDSMPRDQRTMMLGMIKEMSAAITNVRVVKQTLTGDRAELQVEGIDTGDKSKARATVEIVREGGAWKFVKERWGG